MLCSFFNWNNRVDNQCVFDRDLRKRFTIVISRSSSILMVLVECHHWVRSPRVRLFAGLIVMAFGIYGLIKGRLCFCCARLDRKLSCGCIITSISSPYGTVSKKSFCILPVWFASLVRWQVVLSVVSSEILTFKVAQDAQLHFNIIDLAT